MFSCFIGRQVAGSTKKTDGEFDENAQLGVGRPDARSSGGSSFVGSGNINNLNDLFY